MTDIAESIIKKIIKDDSAWIYLYDHPHPGDEPGETYSWGVDGGFGLTGEEALYIKNLMEAGNE